MKGFELINECACFLNTLSAQNEYTVKNTADCLKIVNIEDTELSPAILFNYVEKLRLSKPYRS